MRTHRRLRTGGACLHAMVIGVVLSGAGVTLGQNRQRATAPQPGRSSGQMSAHVIPADLLADLGAPEVERREAATLRLSTGDDFSLKDLEHTLRTQALSTEQRFRLLQAAREKFISGPHAAMGVQFSGSLPDRVVVRLTFAQFPSSRLIEPGDIIISVAGETLRGRDAQNQLGAQIIARDPGDILPIVVRRGEEKIKLDVPLGQFSDLPQANLDQFRLARAWMVRSAGYIASGVVQPIDCGLPADKWEPGTESAQQIRKTRVQMQLPVYRARVVAGGQARGGALDNEEINALFNRQNKGPLMDLRIIQPPANIFIDPFADTGGARARSVNDEIADLEKMIEKTKRVEEMQPKNPGQPNPGNVANPNAMMGVQPDTLKMLERELRALKAEAAEKGPVEDAGTHLAQP